jgi:hypothetical protein
MMVKNFLVTRASNFMRTTLGWLWNAMITERGVSMAYVLMAADDAGELVSRSRAELTRTGI